MPIPDFQSFLAPILQLTSDGAEHSTNELREKIAESLKLTGEELEQRLPSGTQSVFANRVAWATVYLMKAGALQKTKRGVYRITERGNELFRAHPERLSVKALNAFPEFVAFHKGYIHQNNQSEFKIESTQTPEEELSAAYEVLRKALAADVIDAVGKISPASFENLVVDLLVAMGYGGSVADAGKAVGRSGDGGIDGIIKEDKLGLDLIYVQAKRWKDSIGRPLVQAFAGSLEGFRARKGVFITTSTFTPDAIAYVQRIEKKVVLIDGKELADLMIEHNVGVTPTRTFTLKRLDSDYFESV
ncbi:MAG TPA: restriction endonuclease [Bryobacteraceae bacterium]|nr:restriction endonuclease [Bryobacteraceae bacterium]